MGFQFCSKSHCLATRLDKSGAYLCRRNREPVLLRQQHQTVYGELGIFSSRNTQQNHTSASLEACAHVGQVNTYFTLWSIFPLHECSLASSTLLISCVLFSSIHFFRASWKKKNTSRHSLLPSDGDWLLSHNLHQCLALCVKSCCLCNVPSVSAHTVKLRKWLVCFGINIENFRRTWLVSQSENPVGHLCSTGHHHPNP